MTALGGIKVLDLTRLLPGPFATLVLADLGAKVDKIEDPTQGDYTRHTPPVVAGMGAAFHALNRGKRSAVVDLKNPAGVTLLRRMLGSYDVLFEQFRPGVLERLGLGHQAMLEANPRLVVCALTGYGQDGPLRDRAGHDLNYLARAGVLGLQGPASGKPQIPAFQLADVSGGLWSVVAIVSALFERERTGKGKIIDIAMLDSVLPFATIALSRLLGGELPQRGNEILTGGAAAYDSYLTKDGEAMTLGALEPKFLMRFCQATGLAPDISAVIPGAHQEETKQKFREVFAQKTRAEWEAFSLEHDCCLEPVLRPDELLNDPQVQARQLFFEQKAGAETLRYYRTPVTPRDQVPEPAPTQGEHTQAILTDVGLSPDEIAELRASGAVR
jgi:crotonobetainyl-CoA:carnitine CoA-transferase CaiB-like acyl-CoA transferase